jgi:hypothetical protein
VRTSMIFNKQPQAIAWGGVLFALALNVGIAGCGSEGLSPSPEVPAAAAPIDSTLPDSSATPLDSTLSTDSTALPPTDSSAAGIVTLAAGTQPGVVFGTYQMAPSDLNSVHTGTLRGGGVTPDNVLALLSGVRAKGGRIVLKLCMGEDKYVKNPDGTFSLTKWKALVDRFRSVNFGPYLSDGTILGHFLIDEPQRTAKWGGKIISQATVEAMAAYSKQIWPSMTTLVRVVPSWLASAPVTYRALDAGWLQYASGKGNAATLVSSEANAAKNRGLGLVVGLNILDGGNGSSGIRGYTRGRWTMSASEIRSYGTALLNHSYACGFYNWTYNHFGPTYFARSDIRSALTEVSNKARSHARTSCRQ